MEDGIWSKTVSWIFWSDVCPLSLLNLCSSFKVFMDSVQNVILHVICKVCAYVRIGSLYSPDNLFLNLLLFVTSLHLELVVLQSISLGLSQLITESSGGSAMFGVPSYFVMHSWCAGIGMVLAASVIVTQFMSSKPCQLIICNLRNVLPGY